MKARFAVPLNEDLVGTLSIELKIGKEMLAHGMRNGYDPESINNLAAQKFQEFVTDMLAAIGVDYDLEP